MMNPRRSAKVAALCGAVVLAVPAVVWVCGFGPAVMETTVAVPVEQQHAALAAAEAMPVDPPQAAAMCSAAVVDADLAIEAEPGLATATAPATASEPETAMAMTAGADAVADAPNTAAAPDEPVIIEAALHVSSPDSATEFPSVQLAIANPSGSVPDDVRQPTGSIEIADECLVADTCIDRYLWALYQRTPKEDTIKVHERRKVTVRRKGKMVTVTRTFTRLVNEDFGWKDPKAAERFGLSMMDYVIGGMDRSFKTKLFHTLHAAERAGLSPGITSAFRDNYRQSIASGMKAATDRSYHGGSLRGGYGHGLAADVVSVNGATRAQRWVSTEAFWKWIDEHGKEFGIGRPYLGRDPPHVAPIDGREYAAHNRGTTTRHAETDKKRHTRLAMREDRSAAKVLKKRKVTQTGGNARGAKQHAVSNPPTMAMAAPGPG